MKQPVERRLAAIFAADVAGYSRLMGADEESAHITPVIIRHHTKTRTSVKDSGRSFSPIIRHNALSTAF
jgi:hypothetical protein